MTVVRVTHPPDAVRGADVTAIRASVSDVKKRAVCPSNGVNKQQSRAGESDDCRPTRRRARSRQTPWVRCCLPDDAVLYSDGGGKVVAAPPAAVRRRPCRARAGQSASPSRSPGAVNGQPGRILRNADGTPWSVLSVDVVDGRIRTIRIMRNPDKLCHMPPRASASSEEW